jgi:hypothetical protein
VLQLSNFCSCIVLLFPSSSPLSPAESVVSALFVLVCPVPVSLETAVGGIRGSRVTNQTVNTNFPAEWRHPTDTNTRATKTDTVTHGDNSGYSRVRECRRLRSHR